MSKSTHNGVDDFVHSFKIDLHKITKGRDYRTLDADDVKHIAALLKHYAETPHNLPTWNLPKVSGDEIVRLVYVIVSTFFPDVVENVKKQWDLSKPVHLKLNDLEKVLKELNIGTGGVVLFGSSAEEDDPEANMVSYLIKAVTKSRFSHVGMVIFDEKYTDVGLWQSTPAICAKLGGGLTRPGPDLAILKEVLKQRKEAHHSYRFAFRPLQTPLDHSQKQKTFAYINTIMSEHWKFPSAVLMGWIWLLSRYPNLAFIAKQLGIDAGISEGTGSDMYCSMLVTNTFLHNGIMSPPIKAGQYSPGDYALPYNILSSVDPNLFGEEYEFIITDL